MNNTSANLENTISIKSFDSMYYILIIFDCVFFHRCFTKFLQIVAIHIHEKVINLGETNQF